MSLLRKNTYLRGFAVCHTLVTRFLFSMSASASLLPFYDLCLAASLLFSSAPPSSSASQYALVYKGFSLLQDDLLYWQLPAQFTGDKVT